MIVWLFLFALLVALDTVAIINEMTGFILFASILLAAAIFLVVKSLFGGE